MRHSFVHPLICCDSETDHLIFDRCVWVRPSIQVAVQLTCLSCNKTTHINLSSDTLQTANNTEWASAQGDDPLVFVLLKRSWQSMRAVIGLKLFSSVTRHLKSHYHNEFNQAPRPDSLSASRRFNLLDDCASEIYIRRRRRPL